MQDQTICKWSKFNKYYEMWRRNNLSAALIHMYRSIYTLNFNIQVQQTGNIEVQMNR